MKSILAKIKARMGDLWWYSVLLFLGLRLGDVINLYVGIILVPKYVPQTELGAVLPLQQMVSLVGLPFGVLVLPLMKFLGQYAERGEYGKVKSLLRDSFFGTAVLMVFVLLLACVVLPFTYTRVRVTGGILSFLIVFSSLAATASQIFLNALNGLKLFSCVVWQSFFGAPARLITMGATIPFAPLPGYFLGQCMPSLVTIAFSIWGLRKRLWNRVKAVPYWKEDGKAIISYLLPLIPWTIMGTVGGAVFSLVIRHRLSDFESAGYYIISRFSDVSMYVGATFAFFLFPMVSSRKSRDAQSLRILFQSMLVTAGAGILIALLLAVSSNYLLGLTQLWANYLPLARLMPLLAFNGALASAIGCFFTYEIAQSRFRFLWYALPLSIISCMGVYAWTGLGFFEGIFPPSVLQFFSSFEPCRLSFIVWYMLFFTVLTLFCVFVDLFFSRIVRNKGKQ